MVAHEGPGLVPHPCKEGRGRHLVVGLVATTTYIYRERERERERESERDRIVKGPHQETREICTVKIRHIQCGGVGKCICELTRKKEPH